LRWGSAPFVELLSLIVKRVRNQTLIQAGIASASAKGITGVRHWLRIISSGSISVASPAGSGGG